MRFEATLSNYELSRLLRRILVDEGVKTASATFGNEFSKNVELFLDHFGSHKIPAIKALRKHGALSLKSAKDLYEALEDEFALESNLSNVERAARHDALETIKTVQRDLEAGRLDGVFADNVELLAEQLDKLTRN